MSRCDGYAKKHTGKVNLNSTMIMFAPRNMDNKEVRLSYETMNDKLIAMGMPFSVKIKIKSNQRMTMMPYSNSHARHDNAGCQRR